MLRYRTVSLNSLILFLEVTHQSVKSLVALEFNIEVRNALDSDFAVGEGLAGKDCNFILVV